MDIADVSTLHKLQSTTATLRYVCYSVGEYCAPVNMAVIGGFNQRQGEALPPNIIDFVPICLYCSNAQKLGQFILRKIIEIVAT